MERRWLTVKETVRYLGLHPKTVYRLCSRRAIPFSKVPGIGIRIDRIELDRMLKASEIPPQDFHAN